MKHLLLVALLVPVAACAGEAILEWGDVANETAYHVERARGVCAPAGLTFSEIAKVGQNVITYTDKGLPEGDDYCWRVRASNPKDFSPYSNLAGKSIEYTTPLAPGMLIVK